MATGKTVLIVDDSEPVRQMLRALLADVADGFIECADGALALAAYREHRPAWVLMDIQMTVMDGLEATRQIMAAFPQACIIIVTQHGDPQTRAAAFASGARAFLVKDELLKLQEIISRQECGSDS